MALIRTLPKVFQAVMDQAISRASVKETSKDFYVSSQGEGRVRSRRVKGENVKAITTM